MDDNILQKIIEAVAPYLGPGDLGKLVDSSTHQTKTFNGFFEKLKYQRKFDLISEEEYFSELEKLRDTYFAEGTDNWVKYTQQIYDYQKKLIEDEKKEIESLYDDIADYATEKLEEILNKQQKLADNLFDLGPLYNVNKVIIGGVTDYYYSLHNVENEIELIKKYGEYMQRLEQRSSELSIPEAASQLLFDEIKKMDSADGLQFMGALLNVNDGVFSDYVMNVQEKHLLSQGVSKDAYSSEFNEAVDSSYKYMRDVLSEAGYEIPEGFYVTGSASAQKFGEGFVDELDNQLEIIRDMIDEFNMGTDTLSLMGGNVYNTTNTSYNITSGNGDDTVEQIKRFETVKRLAGVN